MLSPLVVTIILSVGITAFENSLQPFKSLPNEKKAKEIRSWVSEYNDRSRFVDMVQYLNDIKREFGNSVSFLVFSFFYSE